MLNSQKISLRGKNELYFSLILPTIYEMKPIIDDYGECHDENLNDRRVEAKLYRDLDFLPALTLCEITIYQQYFEGDKFAPGYWTWDTTKNAIVEGLSVPGSVEIPHEELPDYFPRIDWAAAEGEL